MSFKFNPFTGNLDWVGSTTASSGPLIIERTLIEDITVTGNQTCLHRDTVIPDGFSITIEDEGELYVIA